MIATLTDLEASWQCTCDIGGGEGCGSSQHRESRFEETSMARIHSFNLTGDAQESLPLLPSKTTSECKVCKSGGFARHDKVEPLGNVWPLTQGDFFFQPLTHCQPSESSGGGCCSCFFTGSCEHGLEGLQLFLVLIVQALLELGTILSVKPTQRATSHVSGVN